MSEWSHLPNAKHIDWMLESVKANPEKWKAARDAARDAAMNAAWKAALEQLPAWSAISALIAWDHSSKYLDMTPDELRIWGKLSDDPACILLLPMIIVLQEMEIA